MPKRNSFLSVLLILAFSPLLAEEEHAESKEHEEYASFERDELDSSGHSFRVKEDESKKVRAFLKTGLGYSTNPYSVPNSDIGNPGSFIYKIRPAFGFEAGNKWASMNAGTFGEGQVVFGESQAPRFMLLNSSAFAKADLLPKSMFTIQVEGMAEETREVEDLFVDSLTQLISTFRAGLRFRKGPFTFRGNGEIKNRTYFDIDQPESGRFAGDDGALNDQSFSVYGKLSWSFSKDFEMFGDAKYGSWYGRDESPIVWSNLLWVNLGVGGWLSKNIRVSLAGGYANDFIRSKTTNEVLSNSTMPFAFVGELKWKTSKDCELIFKADRSLHARSLFLDVYTTHLALDYRRRFAEDFTFVFMPYFKVYEYGKPLLEDGTGFLEGNPRMDLVLGMREEVMYFVKDWFSVAFSHRGRYRWTNASDFQIFREEGWVADADGNTPVGNVQNEFLLSANLYY